MATYNSSTNFGNESAYLNGLMSTGSAGQKSWARAQLAELNAAREALNPIPDLHMGDFSAALDLITGQSEMSSARSLKYARQYQDWSAAQAAAANQINIEEAAKNRDWQEYMSSTAHQREVHDLMLAGLNPVLSASGGNGAAVTSGAAASAMMPSGSAAQSDLSGNSAIVALLSTLLSAQTSVANNAVSAATQRAVADKYTAMSKLTAQIASEASHYAADSQYRIRQDFPESWIGLVEAILSGDGTFGAPASGIKDWLASLVSSTPSETSDALDNYSNKPDKGRYGSRGSR